MAKVVRFARLFVMPTVISACLLFGSRVWAAPAGPISGWQKGTEPSWVSMYEYVPSNLAPNPPILVLVHYCGGNAAGVFGEAQGGGIVAAADKYGFLMVVPQTSQNCWDIATKPSLTHNGGGDTGAIVDMVKYAITKHSANANRVYVTGTSSGAMMMQGLVAVYPDVFKGGAEFAGVPAGCWAVNDPAGQWSGPCAGGQVTHTAAEWGTMVRDMYPGYTGFRPRVQLWHGQADSIISYTNQTEAIKEWTNVLGITTDPTMTSVSITNHQYDRQQWMDSCGSVVLDAWAEVGGPHGTDANLNAEYVIPFLALDKSDAIDPQVAKCAGDAPGGSGGAGGASSGGASGMSSGGAGGGGAGGAISVGVSGTVGSGGAGMNIGSSGTSAGTGGQNPSGNVGGAAGSSVAGTSGVSNSHVAQVPSRPGCVCDLGRRGRRSGAQDAFVWAGVLAVHLVLGRRRAKRLAER